MRVIRWLVFLLVAGGITALLLPFLVASLYIDQRGIRISGRVSSKTENVSLRHSDWSRSCQLQIEYHPPDGSGAEFAIAKLEPEEYDTFRVGQHVNLHYLQRKDVPDLPMASTMREIRLLPAARLEGQSTFSPLRSFIRHHPLGLSVLAGIAVSLIFWRVTALPRFGWAVAACVVAGIGIMLVSDFPTAEPRPSRDVLQTTGRIKYLGRIEWLFEGRHESGTRAAQPIDVAGVEYTPEGRPEPVVAVDLIDAESIAGLKVGSTVNVEYERGSPRTAYLLDATRTFPRRNLEGIAAEALLGVLMIGGLLLGIRFLGRKFNEWIRSSN